MQLHVGYRSLRLCEAQLLASLALPGERVWYGFFHGRVLEIVMFAINRTSARRTQGELSRFTSMAHINGTHVLSLLTFITSKLGMVAAEENVVDCLPYESYRMVPVSPNMPQCLANVQEPSCKYFTLSFCT